jgi:predicted transcriptional regulator
MPQSMLEQYIDIAKIVNDYGPLNAQDLASLLKIDLSSLKEHTNFLISQRILKEKNHGLTSTYIITKHGTKILKFFNVKPLIKVAAN